MHKKFEINLTKIKSGCQSGRKVVAHNSKSDLPLMNSIKGDGGKKNMSFLTFLCWHDVHWHHIFFVGGL